MKPILTGLILCTLAMSNTAIAGDVLSNEASSEEELWDGDGILLDIGRIYPDVQIKPFYDDNLLRAPGNELGL